MTPGSLVGKQYRLTRQLGAGAMGVVWAAINEKTSREVALKLVLQSTEELRHRLKREAHACGALQHRNIVDIYDVGETDEGDPFLVMQLLHGETLAERLARQRRLEPHDAASIARDVASALQAAHGANIIHRDLKPANIFLHHEAGSEGTVVKVLDFGVSKNLASSDGLTTVAGGMVGSPAYMSPEQAVGARTIDHRTDLWSLGVVLFETLTGIRPFQGDSTQIIVKIGTGDIPLVSRYVRRIDDGFVQLVARCLERDVTRRVPTAKELAERLDRYIAAPNTRPPTASISDAVAPAPRIEPPSAPVAPLIADPATRPIARSADPSTRSPRLPGMSPAPAMPTMPDGDEPDAETARLDPNVLGAMARRGPSFANAPRLAAGEQAPSRSDISSGQAPLRPVMPGAPGTIPLAPQSDPGASVSNPPMPASAPRFGVPEGPTQPLQASVHAAPLFGAPPPVGVVHNMTERLGPQPAYAPDGPRGEESRAAAFEPPEPPRAAMTSHFDVAPGALVTAHGTVRIAPEVAKHFSPPSHAAQAPLEGLPGSSSTGPLTRAPASGAAGEEPIVLPMRRTGLYIGIAVGVVALATLGVGLAWALGTPSAAEAPASSGATTAAAPTATASAAATATVAPTAEPPAPPTPPPSVSATATAAPVVPTASAPKAPRGPYVPHPGKPRQGTTKPVGGGLPPFLQSKPGTYNPNRP